MLGRSLIWVGRFVMIGVIIGAAMTVRWRSVDLSLGSVAQLSLCRGAIAFHYSLRPGSWYPGIRLSRSYDARPEIRTLEDWRWAVRPQFGGGRTDGYFSIPFWVVFGLAAAPSIWAAARRKRSAGRCASCGYDLHGNTSGRCPECGTTADALKPGRRNWPARLAVEFGFVHLVVMLAFWCGPAGLNSILWLIDWPAALFFSHISTPDDLALLASILTCSILYPLSLYAVLIFGGAGNRARLGRLLNDRIPA